MYTPSALEVGPKSYPHTFSKIVERVSTCRGWRMNSSSSRNSVFDSSIAPVAAANLVRDRVEHEVGVAEDLAVGAVARAAQQRAQTRLELAQRERLDQVVVGADVESLDPVVDRVARGQHQDRGPVARLAHPPAHLEPVELAASRCRGSPRPAATWRARRAPPRRRRRAPRRSGRAAAPARAPAGRRARRPPPSTRAMRHIMARSAKSW